MKTFILAALAALALIGSANAATITITVTKSDGSVLATASGTTDDTSAQAMIAAYGSVLNGDTSSPGHCGPSCTPEQIAHVWVTQFGAQAAQFTNQVTANQAAAAAIAAAPTVSAPQ